MVNSTGTSHSPQGLKWPTQKAACEALSLFSPATLQRTLNRTFHSLHHRGNPLNDDRERKIPSLCPMIPFCCQAGISLVRESNMASSRWIVQKVTGCKIGRLHIRGNSGSHSKLSHLWNLFIYQWLNLLPLLRSIMAWMQMFLIDSICNFVEILLTQVFFITEDTYIWRGGKLFFFDYL